MLKYHSSTHVLAVAGAPNDWKVYKIHRCKYHYSIFIIMIVFTFHKNGVDDIHFKIIFWCNWAQTLSWVFTQSLGDTIIDLRTEMCVSFLCSMIYFKVYMILSNGNYFWHHSKAILYVSLTFVMIFKSVSKWVTH